jgi:hypothetical protein
LSRNYLEYFILDHGKISIVKVQIVNETERKPFLGGLRFLPSEQEFHHAITQTAPIRKRTWSQQLEGLDS